MIEFPAAPDTVVGCHLGRMMGTDVFLSHILGRRSCGSHWLETGEAGGLATAGCDIPRGCPVCCSYLLILVVKHEGLCVLHVLML